MSGTSIIVDAGSYRCKAGFSGRSAPTVSFPSIIGQPRVTGVSKSGLGVEIYLEKEPYLVGDEAYDETNVQQAEFPIQRGMVSDWDGMTWIWEHIFDDQLQVSPEVHPILLTTSPSITKRDKEMMAKVMFEFFMTPSMNLADQAVLTMWSSRCRTGVVVEAGGGVTHVVPIQDYHVLLDGVQRLLLGGKDLTRYASQMLLERNFNKKIMSNRKLMDYFKHELCYVAEDYEIEMTSVEPSEPNYFKLPGEKSFEVGPERFRCPEALFKPSLMAFKYGGIHEAVNLSIRRCQPELHDRLYSNIVVTGGSTLFEGFHNRLRREIANLDPSAKNIQLRSPPNKKYSAWLGGADLASQLDFSWISKQEYEEYGPTIVHAKCI